MARLGHCEPMGLELRFTEAETSLAPPDVTAFAAVDHALLREQLADHDDISPLGDLVTASLIASRLDWVDAEPSRAKAPVFVAQRHWPIPAIARPSTPALSDLREADPEDFLLADHAHGHFAWPHSRHSRGAAALVLAACIPMFVPNTASAQSPTAQSPSAQSPSARSSSAQSPSTLPPPPILPPAPAPALPTPPPPTTAITQELDPPPTAQEPGHVSLQAVLYALKGHEAIVFVGARMISGLVIGVDGGFVMMVDESREGRIAMIPKEQITDVRGKVRSQGRTGGSAAKLPPDGTGMLAGGGILVAFGTPLFISGVVFVALLPSYAPVWAPQLLPAMAFLGGGIPLLVSGSRRRQAYNQAMFENRLGRLTPAVGRTPHGAWTGGLTLRF